MQNKSSLILKTLILFLIIVQSLAASDDIDHVMSLKQQIDTQKHELIELGRDIKILEEVLLFPEDNRINIFLTMNVAELFSLEKVKLVLNNEVVAEYVYSNREVVGFGKGSAQRLYIGNLRPGKYKITSIFYGVGPRGRPYKRGVSREFIKEESQKTFEISVEDDVRKQQPVFYIRDVS